MAEVAKSTPELQVKMFGDFTLSYQGKALVSEKTSETQFAYLMQMILHYRDKGVSRDELESAVFGDREVENVHHALQCVIYNAKKRLEKAGLPKCSYIISKKGNFFWTDEIPVREDATEFMELMEQAEQEPEREEKMELLSDALYHYSGDFLAKYITVVWAAAEARKYRQTFYRGVEELLRLLREKQEYERMYRLGQYAVRIQPFSNWESIEMEALIGLGREDDARAVYERTVDNYLQERGMRPSDKLMELLNRLGGQLEHSYALLDEIYEEIRETFSSERGGYLVSYPVFQGICQMVLRMAERGGQSYYLVLCTILDSKGNPMRDSQQLESRSERLEEAIRVSLRRGDAFTRYGKGQYVVLLVNTTIENCNVVQRRISKNFAEGRQRVGVDYHVCSLMKADAVQQPRRFGMNLWG